MERNVSRMRNIFIISDTHFGHANILKFTDSNTGLSIRPGFASVEEMDELMIERWNAVVQDQDIVYHLGDVYMGQGHRVLPRLRGRKRLVLGNHDNAKSCYLQNHFQKIMMWRMFPEFGLMLSHVPLHASSLRLGPPNDPDAPVLFNVMGHIHQNPAPRGPYRCVCVEQTDYIPVNIETLAAEAKYYKENQLEKDLPLFHP